MSAVLKWFREFVGPAALTAAGMIGAGAVATRLLAGAWFGFDLLWCALYVIPMVIFTLDSASRVAVMNGGRGMFDMIRTDIGAWLAWLIIIPTVLVNVVVNMSQMSAMVEGAYGSVGLLPPASIGDSSSLIVVTVVATIVTLAAAVLGGYKRVEKIMTALLLVILVSFLVVAIKGLMDWSTWPALAGGLLPTVPSDAPVMGDTRVRSGFTQIIAIAGQALPPSVMLAYGYLAANAGQVKSDLKLAFRKTVQNLGIVWGLFSVMVIVAGSTALHATYNGSGPTYLGVSHYSQIESIPVAGQVLGPAFPGALSFLAPRFFSLGLIAAAFTTLISVSLTMTYFCLDMARRNWHFTPDNRQFKFVFAFWIAVPSLLAPFWKLPALLKAILAMAGNLALAPIAILVILYFVNRPVMGEFRASPGRNAVLVITALFATVLVANGLWGYFEVIESRVRAGVVSAIERVGVVAVIRLTDATVGRDVALALADGGVTALEVTMTVPRAIELIDELVHTLPASCIVGAGTVVDRTTAEAVMDAGAQFVVGPVLRGEVIAACRARDVAVMPGCFTPTEILTAWDAGADIVKVFPATSLGPTFIKDLRGPLPHVKLMPTGGVTRANAADWIRAGAVAIGVGTALVDSAAVKERRFDAITASAREFVTAVASARPADAGVSR